MLILCVCIITPLVPTVACTRVVFLVTMLLALVPFLSSTTVAIAMLALLVTMSLLLCSTSTVDRSNARHHCRDGPERGAGCVYIIPSQETHERSNTSWCLSVYRHCSHITQTQRSTASPHNMQGSFLVGSLALLLLQHLRRNQSSQD